MPAAHPAAPLGASYRTGMVSSDMTGMPFTCNVDIGGDNQGNDYDSGISWPCAYLPSYTPVAGDTVVLLGRPGAYIVIGRLPLDGSLGMLYSRYTWAATRNGVAGGAFLDLGTPPTTPWSTGATSGGNTSKITITKNCYLAMHVVFTGQAVVNLSLPTTGANTASFAAQTQGGGTYLGAVIYAGLLGSGEVIELVTRNVAAGLINVVVKGFLTFTDAVIGTIQT